MTMDPRGSNFGPKFVQYFKQVVDKIVDEHNHNSIPLHQINTSWIDGIRFNPEMSEYWKDVRNRLVEKLYSAENPISLRNIN